MKHKTFINIALLVTGMILFFTLNANADFDRYICKVIMTGPAGNNTWIVLTDTAVAPTFSETGFVFPEDRAKEMMAIALTAITSNLKVEAIVNLGSTGTVYAIFVYSE